jgi:hypothetical protein
MNLNDPQNQSVIQSIIQLFNYSIIQSTSPHLRPTSLSSCDLSSAGACMAQLATVFEGLVKL